MEEHAGVCSSPWTRSSAIGVTKRNSDRRFDSGQDVALRTDRCLHKRGGQNILSLEHHQHQMRGESRQLNAIGSDLRRSEVKPAAEAVGATGMFEVLGVAAPMPRPILILFMQLFMQLFAFRPATRGSSLWSTGQMGHHGKSTRSLAPYHHLWQKCPITVTATMTVGPINASACRISSKSFEKRDKTAATLLGGGQCTPAALRRPPSMHSPDLSQFAQSATRRIGNEQSRDHELHPRPPTVNPVS